MPAMNPPARALFILLWLIGCLPLRGLHALGDAIAWTARVLGLRETRTTARNLELCFPALDASARARLYRDSLRASARTLAETCRLFTRPSVRNLAWVREVDGAALLHEAQASARGVIVAAPHLGNWELLNQYLAAQAPIHIVYRAPRQAWIEDLLLRARGHEGVSQVRAEAAGVRQLLRVLSHGGTVGILPDQQPKRGDGEFAGFFGVPAFTMTLLPRLAQRTGATVLFAWAERLDDGSGFRIRIRAADRALHGPDLLPAVSALNAGVEACVRQAPAQYQWGYKRFSMRPHGEPGLY